MNRTHLPSPFLPPSGWAWPKAALAVAAVVLLGISVRADDPDEPAPPPPSAPYVAQPPPGSKWSVEIKETASAPKDANPGQPPTPPKPFGPVLLEIESGQNGVIQGTVTTANSTQRTYYIARGLLLQPFANSPRIAATPAGNTGNNPNSLQVAGFPGVGWVSLQNYVGAEQIDHVYYYHYRIAQVAGYIGKLELEAWIRATDRHPFRAVIDSGKDDKFEYKFSEITPFPEDISLPAKDRAAVDGILGVSSK